VCVIYWKTRKPGNKYYCKRIVHLNLAPYTAVFALSAQRFYMILHEFLLYFSISTDVLKIYLKWILECVRYTDNYDVEIISDFK
jgi:hypothetical protein